MFIRRPDQVGIQSLAVRSREPKVFEVGDAELRRVRDGGAGADRDVAWVDELSATVRINSCTTSATAMPYPPSSFAVVMILLQFAMAAVSPCRSGLAHEASKTSFRCSGSHFFSTASVEVVYFADVSQVLKIEGI